MKKYVKPAFEHIEFELMEDILAASGEVTVPMAVPGIEDWRATGAGSENACRKSKHFRYLW